MMLTGTGRRWSVRPREVLFLLITLHVGLLVWAAVSNSVTFDEYNHLPAGVAYWTSGSWFINNVSPPLLRMWGALPVLFAGVRAVPVEVFAGFHPLSRHWQYGEAFLHANANAYPELFVLARLAMIPLSCLGAWLTYRWAGAMYGVRASLAACFLYVLCPNILAYGSLVTTDVGTAVVVTAALWFWWRFCREPSWRRGLAAAWVVGVAHLCKFSAIMLWPMLGMVGGWCLLTGHRGQWRQFLGWFLGSALFTLVLVNVMYGLQGSGSSLASYTFLSKAGQALQWLPGWLPVPLPRELVIGLDAQMAEIKGQVVGFILGERYLGSRWYYYPVALACKLPLSTLALAGLATSSALRRSSERSFWRREESVLVILLGLGFSMALAAEVNAGIRYLFPLFPMLFIWISRLWAPAASSSPRPVWLQRLSCGLLITLALEHCSVAPRYLTFVNLAAGGPTYGWRAVNEGNFDMGQGLIDLKRWMDRHHVERIQLAYQGPVDPAVYGIRYTPLIWQGQRPNLTEDYIGVASFYLVGLRAHIRTPGWRGANRFKLLFYRQLQAQRPVAVVGSTLFIYTRDEVQAAIREFHASSAPRETLDSS